MIAPRFFLLLVCSFLGWASTGLVGQEKPNIVLFYLDDWAWNGSPIPMNDSVENSFMPILEMPRLEQLAREGMKFTNAYGSHQCAPARASLQTGQSGPRTGLTLVLGNQKDDYYDTRPQYRNLPLVPNIADESLDADALTIPEALEPLGYVSAHLGKWHLYSDPGAEGYVLHDGDTDNKPGTPKDPAIAEKDPKLMFSITEKAIGFIKEQAAQDRPFYCQISHYAMHAGSQCLPETFEKYAAHPKLQAYYETLAKRPKPKQDPAMWLGMGEDLDGRIGAVLDTLASLGIEDNTYVVVVSDNGYRHSALGITPGTKQPLHAHKWWAWQGGIRVPMFVKGPGIAANSTFEGNVINYDFLPTFVEWAGGDPETLPEIDGVSLAAYMAGQDPDREFLNRPLYLHVPHYREEIPHSIIVAGDAKVIHFYERPDIPMLFNLADDPGETTNIARQFPETHERLFEQMMTYLEEVEARFPKVNPEYDPEVYQRHKNYAKYQRWGPFEGTRPLAEDEL
ncbi:MAG: sulfatase-like hydrolase/transferase [Verrucomicrobiota bacterium]